MNALTYRRPWQMNRTARIARRMEEIEKAMTERLMDGEVYSAQRWTGAYVWTECVGPEQVVSELYHKDSELVDRALATMIRDPIAAQQMIQPLVKGAIEQVIAGFPVRECAEFMEWEEGRAA